MESKIQEEKEIIQKFDYLGFVKDPWLFVLVGGISLTFYLIMQL